MPGKEDSTDFVYRRFTVIHEDNHVLVVIKPQGLLCQGDEHSDENLLDQLKEYIQKTRNKPGNVYLGLVHRLDRNTGGLMVFAKTSKAAARLSEQFRKHTVKKTYLAAIESPIQPAQGSMTDYIKKNSQMKKAIVVKPDDKESKTAKHAELIYKTVGKKQQSTQKPPLIIVEVELLTGRFHQIRAQFASRNRPLAGDVKYGSTLRLGGPALWAYSLTFIHPTKGQSLSFFAETPVNWPFGFRR